MISFFFLPKQVEEGKMSPNFFQVGPPLALSLAKQLKIK